jgi:hypothetical protein
MLPSLAEAFAVSPERIDGKRVLFLAQHFPSSLLGSSPLRAIVEPRHGAERHALTRIPSPQALRMVAPSTMMQLPGDRESTLARLAALVRELPCFELAVGRDPHAAVPLLDALARGKGS